jgi:hypothetical protein
VHKKKVPAAIFGTRGYMRRTVRKLLLDSIENEFTVHTVELFKSFPDPVMNAQNYLSLLSQVPSMMVVSVNDRSQRAANL